MPVMERRPTSPRHRDAAGMYSPQSVLHAMDRFRSAVGAMENSVLVPCRLQDIPDPVMGDLYAAYKLLSRTKVDLLYGDENSQQNGKISRRTSPIVPVANGTSKAQENGSLNGRSDVKNGDDKDALRNGDEQVALDPTMLKLHANLNQNLKNLYAILDQMTDAANRVTNMYLKEVENP